MTINPEWVGKVQFYELIYGTWMAYIFLVLAWEKILRQPLDEWRYILLNFMGAGAYWVNHYFQGAPFYMWLLNLYTLIFFIVWCVVGIRGHNSRPLWKAGAALMAVIYTLAFIGFETIARIGVDQLGYSEFWFMLTAYLGFVFIIVWRGKYAARRD